MFSRIFGKPKLNRLIEIEVHPTIYNRNGKFSGWISVPCSYCYEFFSLGTIGTDTNVKNLITDEFKDLARIDLGAKGDHLIFRIKSKTEFTQNDLDRAMNIFKGDNVNLLFHDHFMHIRLVDARFI